jgi:hypothetical protein
MTMAQPQLKVTCLCGSSSYILPSSCTLPMETVMCHCNDCRHLTGAIFLTSPELSEPPPKTILEKCKSYDSSGVRRRWFCEACGTHVLCQEISGDGERWWVMGGAIEGPSTDGSVKDTNETTHHIFANDAADGGLAASLTKINEKEVPCWEKRQETSKMIESNGLRNMSKHSSVDITAESDALPLKCHCGGINIEIRRSDYDKHPIGEGYMPGNRHKYTAALCACRSCRLATGVTLQPWAYIPPKNILIAGTKQSVPFREIIKPDAPAFQSLKCRWSSEDVCRGFCGTCGATVFYWHEQRQEVVDISVGLMRSEDGTMARKWLSWWEDKVSWQEECVDQALLEAMFSRKIL